MFQIHKDVVEKILGGCTNFTNMLGLDLAMQIYFVSLSIQYSGLLVKNKDVFFEEIIQ